MRFVDAANVYVSRYAAGTQNLQKGINKHI